jgi:hypothetical protein
MSSPFNQAGQQVGTQVNISQTDGNGFNQDDQSVFAQYQVNWDVDIDDGTKKLIRKLLIEAREAFEAGHLVAGFSRLGDIEELVS